jgi:hypothetical protein
MRTTTLPVENSMNCSPLRRGFIFVAIAWFALSPAVRAVSPPPDGGYANGNTAEGTDALFSLTTGTDNTAAGFLALVHNTTGFDNTANGFEALALNTTGFQNVANGFEALFHNTTGFQNAGNGFEALFENTSGFHNTANGFEALLRNTTGNHNTANGDRALEGNTTGNDNTTDGAHSLGANTTGSRNIALGFGAGANLTTGNDNIDIGNAGVVGEANTIRIGTEGTQSATFIAGISRATVAGGVGVIVDTNGHLGTVSSSKRFKDQIKPMDKASEGILALRPVTFHYKKEFDPESIPQFGLIAEEVEKVNPNLVARDAKGQVYTVRYEAVNAMLLNEFLKEHRTVQEQERTVQEQEATIAQLKNGMKVLTASLKEQAAQIQKVSAQMEVNRPTPQVVLNNP